MTDAMAAMLDELMGKTRNANKEEQGKKMAFNDPDVCQYALAGLCPYTLFSNTKSDLGAFLRIPSIAAHQVISTLSYILFFAGTCGWIVHDNHIEYPRLKEEYDAISDRDKESLGYGRKLYRLLFELVQEMDKKIARSQERVEKENQPRPIKPADQLRLDALKQQAKGTLVPSTLC
jgi:RNA-binding protein Luc7-like 2